jgi:hypothetical protein
MLSGQMLRPVLVLLAAFACCAVAQTYPARPVRILLGFPVGQATDVLARIVATRLSAQYGQQFYVENRPGAAGIIATEMAAKAEPDGYTLLGTSSGPLTVNPALYAKLPYDVARDLVVFAGPGIQGRCRHRHAARALQRRSRRADRSRGRPGRRDVRNLARNAAAGERRQAARPRRLEREARRGRARAADYFRKRLPALHRRAVGRDGRADQDAAADRGAAVVKAETLKWGKAVKASGAKVD